MVESAKYEVADIFPGKENIICEDSGLYEDSDEGQDIEISIKDEAGNPLPNVDYKLEFVDGSARTGTTDEEGRIAEADVPSGQFYLTISSEEAEDEDQDADA